MDQQHVALAAVLGRLPERRHRLSRNAFMSTPALHAEISGNGAAPTPPSPPPKVARKQKKRRKARSKQAVAAARARFWHRGMKTIPAAADERPEEDLAEVPKRANSRVGKAVTFDDLAATLAHPEPAAPAPINATAAADPVIDHAEQRLALASRISALTERVMDLLETRAS